jgi:hypothetical protein
VAAVIYAAKSTEDPHGSLGPQIADCKVALEREGRTSYGDPQIDERYSAYKRNRGPGLAEAKRLASEAAARYGSAELWVQHSDRLARGDGVRADHLVEVWLETRRQAVRLRSVQDDGNLENIVMATLIGERNTEDSRRKAQAVRAGKARQLSRGERLGGPVPDGYQRSLCVAADKVVAHYTLDPARAPTIRRAFDLAAEGLGDPSVARRLNGEGHRTKAGGFFRRRRVQDLLTNPYYAGRVVRYRGRDNQEVAVGTHEPIVDPHEFDRLLAMRAKRDAATGDPRRRSRPSRRFVLAGLALCARCGRTMWAVSSTYRRKDGTRAQKYTCPCYHDSTGGCDQPPIDASVVDPYVLSQFAGIAIDHSDLIKTFILQRSTERQRRREALAAATKGLARVERLENKVRENYLDAMGSGNHEREQVARETLERLYRDRTQMKQRARSAEASLLQASASTPEDMISDFCTDMAAAIRGAASGTVQEVNDALQGLFDGIVLDRTPEHVLIWPLMRHDIAQVLGYEPLVPVLQVTDSRKERMLRIKWVLNDAVRQAADAADDRVPEPVRAHAQA